MKIISQANYSQLFHKAELILREDLQYQRDTIKCTLGEELDILHHPTHSLENKTIYITYQELEKELQDLITFQFDLKIIDDLLNVVEPHEKPILEQELEPIKQKCILKKKWQEYHLQKKQMAEYINPLRNKVIGELGLLFLSTEISFENENWAFWIEKNVNNPMIQNFIHSDVPWISLSFLFAGLIFQNLHRIEKKDEEGAILDNLKKQLKKETKDLDNI